MHAHHLWLAAFLSLSTQIQATFFFFYTFCSSFAMTHFETARRFSHKAYLGMGTQQKPVIRSKFDTSESVLRMNYDASTVMMHERRSKYPILFSLSAYSPSLLSHSAPMTQHNVLDRNSSSRVYN
jgi:hypothetical protein